MFEVVNERGRYFLRLKKNPSDNKQFNKSRGELVDRLRVMARTADVAMAAKKTPKFISAQKVKVEVVMKGAKPKVGLTLMQLRAVAAVRKNKLKLEISTQKVVSLPHKQDHSAFARGGIDLNTSSGMQWKVSKDGNGVEMNIDAAMIARIEREGIDSLSPEILKMTLVTSVWPLVGLPAPS